MVTPWLRNGALVLVTTPDDLGPCQEYCEALKAEVRRLRGRLYNGDLDEEPDDALVHDRWEEARGER